MPKTGTTSIQESLHINRERISNLGVFIPTSLGRRNHRRFSKIFEKFPSDYFFDKTSRHASLSKKKATDSENLRRLENEVRLASGHHSFVISSEQMSWRYESTEIQHLAAVCKKYFDTITVVIFLRPQWVAIPSRYWLDLRTSLLWKSFGRWLREEAIDFRQFDYPQLLDTWATNFPEAKIQPIFMPDSDTFDSVDTFYRDVLMHDPKDVTHLPVGRKNQSGSGLDVMALRVLNLLIDICYRLRRSRKIGTAALRAKRRMNGMTPFARGFRSYRVSKRHSRQITRHFLLSNQVLHSKYLSNTPVAPVCEDRQLPNPNDLSA